MKTASRFDDDSSSTQERERRFSRRNSQRPSRSKSNQSDTSSLSKFFVRNVDRPPQNNHLQEILNKNIRNPSDWSPQKRQPTPHKTLIEKQMKLGKEQLLRQQAKDLANLRSEMQKYQNYIKKQTKENESLIKQNQRLKLKLQNLEADILLEKKRTTTLKSEISQLESKLNKKDLMVESLQKDQTPLRKMKNTIMQARIQEFEKEREELNFKIKELQQTIDDLKSGNVSFSAKSSINYDTNCESGIVKPFEDDHIQNMQMELFQSKEEIKRLNIQLSCQQRKFYKQMESYKQTKQKDYLELKQKFNGFLKKYQLTMKKFASYQVKDLAEKSRRNKSVESLTLSSDEETTAQ